MKIETSLYQVGLRMLGLKEIPGNNDNPFINWCLSTTSVPGPYHDETGWCSAWLNGLCYLLGLPRSGSASARSWLTVGTEVALEDAIIGLDVVVLKRGTEPQPGPEVLDAPGHVGIYAGTAGGGVLLLAGNQGDKVSIESFKASSVLGVRRLA